jgi:SNF2 family DNA or RNA helicase
MFLKLRMFTSHLLAAQDVVQYGLSDEIVNELRALDEKYDRKVNPSGQITRMLLLAKFECSIPTAPAVPAEDEMTHTPPTGDRGKLVKEFREFMESLHEEERWQDRLERLECPLCCHIPVKAIITSCKHMYCEECFHQLPDEDGRLGTENKICRGCMNPITEAAQCGAFDKVDPSGYESSSSASSSSPAKRKRQERAKKSKASKKPRKGAKGLMASAMFCKYRFQTDDSDDENEPDHDFVPEDWIPVIGEHTPGSKLAKVKDIVVEWMKQDNSVKIVLFTQFLDTIRLLKFMCAQQGWKYTTAST